MSDERGEGEPLAVTIVDGKLVIEIGVDTLRFCAEMQACRFDDGLNDYVYPLKVVDRHEYARDVVHALNDEREDGSTILTDLLDKAFMTAWEDGSTGCGEEGYGTQKPSPVPPPAPTTGDEGKEEVPLDPHKFQSCNDAACYDCESPAREEMCHECGLLLGALAHQPPPPHQAQTHAFVGCTQETCFHVTPAHHPNWICHAPGCAQPESAPCHGREGK